MTPPLNHKRGSSVSFTRAKDDADDNGDEIQISLAPYIQTYLAHSGQGMGCCGIGLPVPFERAAPRSWWNPKFDSEILEGQYRRSAFPQIRLRFRYALSYILLVSVSWLAYFVITGIENNTSTWPAIAGIFSAVGAMVTAILYLTHTDYYRSYALTTSIVLACTLCFLSLLFVTLVPPYSDGLTLVGHFALCTEILLLIYTVIPMRLYACVGITTVYSFLFEFLTAYLYGSDSVKQLTLIGDIPRINSTINESVSNYIERSDHNDVRFQRDLNTRSDSPSLISSFGNLTDNMETISRLNHSNLISNLSIASSDSPSVISKLTEALNTSSVLSNLNSNVISAINSGNIISGMNDTNTPATNDSNFNSESLFSNLTSNLISFAESSLETIVLNNSMANNSNPILRLTNSTLISNVTNPELISTLSDHAFTTSLNDSNFISNFEFSRELYLGDADFGTILTIRILMQICIHMIGFHILIMTYGRMRGTFMKVGQSLLVRRQLEMEKQLKEKMIHSVMPPKVADWLMEESEREREREDSIKKGSIPSNNADIRSLFRPFNMHCMEDVSILFADIVGFTRMSSNKTAEELVGILNDLFERFDELCVHHGCEKISTLGDCYYCVSGCPEPRSDHAKCCVEMGLAMIEAIKQFDIERREGVNMRVGVHTGTVLCGIVGTKRFKFDVWSNDVTLANKLESTGKPGRVHLSEKTLSFLDDQYLTEEGNHITGVKSFFIRGRKSDLMTQFMMNVSSSTSISPLLQPRERVASCNNQNKQRTHYLHMVTNPSNYKIKANSLPSILDSDNEGDTGDEKEGLNKSPTSTASYGKKKIRNKPWRYLQRQRTTEEMAPLEKHEKVDIVVSETQKSIVHEEPNGYEQVPLNNRIEIDPMPVTPTCPLLPDQEPISQAPSVCSRKDSGIRSNSRRSSIQQQLFLMNGMAQQGDLMGHRVSGYYTSSQSTINSVQDNSSSVPPYPFPPAVTDTFGACFHKLRKQSDLQLIRCVQDNVNSQRSYFVKPPLSSVTLFFKNKEMEQEYRENAHKASEGIGDNPPTLATSRFNTYFDILISAIVYTAITVSLFLLYWPTKFYVVFCATATTIQLFAVCLCIRQIFNPNTAHANYTQKIFKFFSRWHPWHACGAVLVSLPIVSIIINFTCNNAHTSLNHFEYYYSYLIFVGLVHFCNFTQLNCWMKNMLVTLTGILFIVLVATHMSYYDRENIILTNYRSINDSLRQSAVDRNFIRPGLTNRYTNGSDSNSSANRHNRVDESSLNSDLTNQNMINNHSRPLANQQEVVDSLKNSQNRFNSTADNFSRQTRASEDLTASSNLNFYFQPTNKTSFDGKLVSRQNGSSKLVLQQEYNKRLYRSEIFLDMILLLLLVWFLNREFEISYRLSFHGNAVAARDKTRVQSMKNQADWLLHNIIPKYVADQLKTTAKYSQNHKSVGIIFASIVNFNELYEESYLGGKEYLRVLNELIGDFDELLEKPEFFNVEKIKTIGSTFMAASGLNPQVRQQSEHEYTHLYQLLDFAVAMHKVIYDFNRDLLGFKLILRVGYNYGDVTAGVIGATKLYYDIWGDAVNIASRMDSTGVAGRIQLASNCLDVLSDRYEFEPRGQVHVKGKDNMNVFLLIGKMENNGRTNVT